MSEIKCFDSELKVGNLYKLSLHKMYGEESLEKEFTYKGIVNTALPPKQNLLGGSEIRHRKDYKFVDSDNNELIMNSWKMLIIPLPRIYDGYAIAKVFERTTHKELDQ